MMDRTANKKLILRMLSALLIVGTFFKGELHAQSLSRDPTESLDQILNHHFYDLPDANYAKIYDPINKNTWHIVGENHSYVKENQRLRERLSAHAKKQKLRGKLVRILLEGKIANTIQETNDFEIGLEPKTIYTIRLVQMWVVNWIISKHAYWNHGDIAYKQYQSYKPNQRLINRIIGLLKDTDFNKPLSCKNLHAIEALDSEELASSLDCFQGILIGALKKLNVASETPSHIKERLQKYLAEPSKSDAKITYHYRDQEFIKQSIGINEKTKHGQIIVIVGEMHVLPLVEGLLDRNLELIQVPSKKIVARNLLFKLTALKGLQNKTAMDHENITYYDQMYKKTDSLSWKP